MLETMEGFANSGRMLAEQVWDRDHTTDYNWEFGEGTGAATPLAWSMAQYVRLAHGIDNGAPVETPAVVADRYLHSERGEGPGLRVNTRFEGDHLVVSGETTGEIVAVRTPSETQLVDVDDGTYEVRAKIEYGENQITVAAASSADLLEAGTTVERFTL
jgi:hypothetical protein